MSDTQSLSQKILGIIKLLRPKDWIKNLFVLAPLLLTPEYLTATNLMLALQGFLAFCFAASSIYVLNDTLDATADSLHPTKRFRPIPAGLVSRPAAIATGLIMFALAISIASFLTMPFIYYLAGYIALNLAYCFFLKHLAVIDVTCIALGFVLRVEAGAKLFSIHASVWLLLMTFLLALFLAFAKRRDDINKAMSCNHRQALKGYNKTFLDTAVTLTLSVLLISYIMYTLDPTNMMRFVGGNVFYTCLFVIVGILRYLQITMVLEQSGSPVHIVLTDKTMVATILMWVASFAYLLYGF